jgi:deoxyadenosine/deoxycytidine kinase
MRTGRSPQTLARRETHDLPLLVVFWEAAPLGPKRTRCGENTAAAIPMFETLLKDCKRPVFVVSLEGLIGCGKSTQLELLKDRYEGDRRVTFVDEPVDDWDELGILQAMYDGELDKGMFQLTALMSRIAPIMTAMHSHAKVIVTERSWISDFMVFAKANLREPIHSAAYQYTFFQLQDALEHLVYIHMTMLYLDCSVDTAMARIQRRARDAESSIPRQYMETLHSLHQRMVAAAATNQLAEHCRTNYVASPRCPPGMETTAVAIDSTTTDRMRIHEIIVAKVESALEKASWSEAAACWMTRQNSPDQQNAVSQRAVPGPHPCDDSRQAGEPLC